MRRGVAIAAVFEPAAVLKICLVLRCLCSNCPAARIAYPRFNFTGCRHSVEVTDRIHYLMSAIIGMYGPPQNCKRKIKMTVWSAPMYSAFGGVQDSWPGWIPPALFFISVAALKASTDIRLRK